MFDLGPAAQQLSRLVAGTDDNQLDAPTPCAEWTVADLLAHVAMFTSVFTANARKQPIDPPVGLMADWRSSIPARLEELARAWTEESAWQGRVEAGGVEMAAADNAVVGIEELTVHGWDLARATGQEFRIDDERLDVVDRFFVLFDQPDRAGEGPFGPRGPVSADADRLQRTLARTGRDPRWEPR